MGKNRAKRLIFPTAADIACKECPDELLRVIDKGLSKLFFFILMLVVYSNSKFLAMTFLSLYGVAYGIVRVPRNRLDAVKSLLHYGAEVLQHGL